MAQATCILKTEALMKEVRRRLEGAAPDVILVMASDHFTNFLYNNLPQFCMGVWESAAYQRPGIKVMPAA